MPQAESINCIAAVRRGTLAQLTTKTGTNSSEDFTIFLKKLLELRHQSFIGVAEETILIFDNATIHTSWKVQEFLTENQLKAMTIAPYTPQLNVAELFIRALKAKASKLLLEGR